MQYKDDLLDDLIDRRISELDDLEKGSAERSRATNDLVNLLNARENRRKDEESRIDKEHEKYVASKKELAERERDEKLDKRKKRSENIDNGVKIAGGIIGGGVAIGQLLLYAAFLKEGFKFEETGHISSKVFSNLLNRIGPKKN